MKFAEKNVVRMSRDDPCVQTRSLCGGAAVMCVAESNVAFPVVSVKNATVAQLDLLCYSPVSIQTKKLDS